MPWCPKCKSEYREGFTVCADCGSELIDEEQFRELEEERAAQEEAARLELALQQVAHMAARKAGGLTVQDVERLAAEAGISGAVVEEAVRLATGQAQASEAALAEDSVEDLAEELQEREAPGSAVRSEAEGAVGADRDFGTAAGMPSEKDAEDGKDGEASARQPEEDAARPKQTAMSPAALYQDSTERANENRSSAWILMIMGGVGLLVVVLGILGVIPLHFSNPYLFYGVMAAVFLLFLVAGMVSLKNARIFDKKAESENSLRDTMLAWCRENLHAQELDSEIGMDGTESEEALYFKRYECIKAKLNYQFVNLDQGFLENFIDDSVYDMVYDERIFKEKEE